MKVFKKFTNQSFADEVNKIFKDRAVSLGSIKDPDYIGAIAGTTETLIEILKLNFPGSYVADYGYGIIWNSDYGLIRVVPSLNEDFIFEGHVHFAFFVEVYNSGSPRVVSGRDVLAVFNVFNSIDSEFIRWMCPFFNITMLPIRG